MLQCVAVCVAVCCRDCISNECVALCCSVLQCVVETAYQMSVLHYVAVCCSVLQCVALC